MYFAQFLVVGDDGGDEGGFPRRNFGAAVRPTSALLFHQRRSRSCIFNAVHQRWLYSL